MSSKRLLVCAPLLPEFDREGGSRRLFHLLEEFGDAGGTITFVAGNASGVARYARRLQQMGIAVFALHGWYGNENAAFELDTLLQMDRFDMAVFAFWYSAETGIPMARRLSFS